MSSIEDRLAAAVDRGDVDAVRAALSEGADPNGAGWWCMGLLECAVERGWVAVMRVLLEAGADPNARSEILSESLLREAVRYEQVEAVRVLAEFGASPDLLDEALHKVIVSRGPSPMAEVLLELGTRVDTADSNGWTSLHFAAAYGYAASVGWLLYAGADASLTTAHGLTAADIAACNGYREMANALRGAAAGLSDNRKVINHRRQAMC